MMRKKITQNVLLLLVMLILPLSAVAANGDIAQSGTGDQTQNTANNQGQSNSPPTANQDLQMLQEIQAMQKKQAAADAGNLSQNVNSTDGSNSNTAPTTYVNHAREAQQYHSNFKYPFANAQFQHGQVMKGIRNGAFGSAVQQALPLNPEEIHRLKQLYNSAQFAAAAPAGTPPKPIATSLYVNLSPGASPPAIRLSEGFVSSLVFLDSTGAPWPIAAYDLGNPSAFNIAWNKKGNVLMVQAKTLYTYGNLAVRLKGLNTPVMLTLIPGQSIVDYRTDITVPGYGPDAKSLPINTGLPPEAAPVLLNILDGVTPQGSDVLQMPSNFGQAWRLKGKMYIRTHYTLLSPGWLATMSSADGTNAYELQPTPMLLMSKNGKIEHVKIGGL